MAENADEPADDVDQQNSGRVKLAFSGRRMMFALEKGTQQQLWAEFYLCNDTEKAKSPTKPKASIYRHSSNVKGAKSCFKKVDWAAVAEELPRTITATNFTLMAVPHWESVGNKVVFSKDRPGTSTSTTPVARKHTRKAANGAPQTSKAKKSSNGKQRQDDLAPICAEEDAERIRTAFQSGEIVIDSEKQDMILAAYSWIHPQTCPRFAFAVRTGKKAHESTEREISSG